MIYRIITSLRPYEHNFVQSISSIQIYKGLMYFQSNVLVLVFAIMLYTCGETHWLAKENFIGNFGKCGGVFVSGSWEKGGGAGEAQLD